MSRNSNAKSKRHTREFRCDKIPFVRWHGLAVMKGLYRSSETTVALRLMKFAALEPRFSNEGGND
jgi:hypothetical protein